MDKTDVPPPESEVPAGAAALTPSAVDALASLRNDVARRMEAVLSGEQRLRNHVKDLKQRLAPLLKQVDDLSDALRLDGPVLGNLLEQGRQQARQNALQLRSLSEGLVWEGQLREEITESGLSRCQKLDQITLSGTDAWLTQLGAEKSRFREQLAALDQQLQQLELRWCPDSESAASGDVPT